MANASQVEEKRQLVVVPDVELVVQRSREADTDEIADEQGADNWKEEDRQ